MRILTVVIVFSMLPLIVANAQSNHSWSFAVSGDSRNCGDIVVPAIAGDAKKEQVAFYWHLGDLRRTSGPDEDFIAERAHEGKPADLAEYEKDEWDDLIQNQIQIWGDTSYYLGIGNHETTPPKSRDMFVAKFHDYLDRPDLREQRLKDDPSAKDPKTYYHWMRDGIDFIFLDNATRDDFDTAQMKWLQGVLDRDAKDTAIRTIVIGMHEALPESISANHSMNEYPSGIETGHVVYGWLLKAQNQDHKKVYVLASHSHYFMDGIFNTAYWREHGGVLPGWIIGTAGAQRYPLPPDANDAKAAKTNVYGYLLATVDPNGAQPGAISFDFREIKEGDIPNDVAERFTKVTVHECFVGNRRTAQIR